MWILINPANYAELEKSIENLEMYKLLTYLEAADNYCYILHVEKLENVGEVQCSFKNHLHRENFIAKIFIEFCT